MFEFEDMRWLPAVIRDGMTGVLEVSIRLFRIYDPVVPVLLKLLPEHRKAKIVDGASGSGGGYYRIKNLLNQKHGQDLEILLTDLYPHKGKSGDSNIKSGCIIYCPQPVDLSDLYKIPADTYTVFAAFHHLSRQDGDAFLKNLASTRRSILIAEGVTPGLLTWCAAIILLPLLALFTVPLIRPFRFEYLIFTYAFPLIPLLTWWDGLVSLSHIRKPEQVKKQAEHAVPWYRWSFGSSGSFLFKMYWVTGVHDTHRPVSPVLYEEGRLKGSP